MNLSRECQRIGCDRPAICIVLIHGHKTYLCKEHEAEHHDDQKKMT